MYLFVRRIALLSICGLLVFGAVVSSADNPFAAHNAYPWRLYPKDRFDRALDSGLKHLEVDITYDPERQVVVATHDAKPSGNEPELGALLAPLWEKWGNASDEGYTLILDFKSASEDVVRGVATLLAEHEELLSKMTKGSDEFRQGKITVCLTGSGAAHATYDRLTSEGADYLAFSDATGRPGSWQEDATSYVPSEPAGFVRFVTLERQNFMDAPRARGNEHISVERMRAAVEVANAGGYRMRIYTINPARSGEGWDTAYWDACLDSGVHMIATDAYDVAHEHWQSYKQAQSATGQ